MTLVDLIQLIKCNRVYEVVQPTPLDKMDLMSTRLNNTIYAKREDQHVVFSFKIRGAYNKMVALSPAQKQQGVIGASAGNHAQGIAYSAAHLGIGATIVMPKTTPAIKVDAVKRLGGEVILHGNNYDEAAQQAGQLSLDSRQCYIHPYDDYEVIAGQGTVAMEILQQADPPPDAVFIPIGGGGLIAGMGAWLKHHHSTIKVIGVEPVESSCMYDALQAGRRVQLEQVGIFADGVAVRQAGEKTYQIARQVVDEVVLVTTDEICAAIKDIYDESRCIMEPAGAVALAGLKQYVGRKQITQQNLVTVHSGANINFDRLRHIAERAEIGEQKEGLFAVTIPERPGSFHQFCRALDRRSITEFNYRYADKNSAHIFVGVQLEAGLLTRDLLMNNLQDKGFAAIDLSDDELAKLHTRYMVGGRAPGLQDERLYRFEFPERPGALLHFLSLLGKKWNISLFHYRNHGSDYGRVLCGIQVPDNELTDFQGFLDGLNYVYREESHNPSYQLFLGY